MKTTMKMKALAFVLALCLGCSTAASAALAPATSTPITVGIHLGTYHSNRALHYNEFNPGIYVERGGWLVGTYFNSEYRQSAYAGYLFRDVLGDPGIHARVHVDVEVGAVTGYRRAKVAPMLVPSVLLYDTIRLSFIPPIEKTGGALHLSVEHAF